ncbi:MAG: hypothetical protein N2D54_03720 [Chloroflexota bacterium]
MINVIALFPNSMSGGELDEFYSMTISGFKSAEGLVSLQVNEGPLMSPGERPDFAKVVTAEFESLEIFMSWAQTPEREADSAKMKEAGMLRIFYEVKDA